MKSLEKGFRHLSREDKLKQLVSMDGSILIIMIHYLVILLLMKKWQIV